jgi:RNA polymerase sigma-70 factor (ECF subfamily)
MNTHRPLAAASETELVQMAQERNAVAFDELMHRNQSTSFRLALSILKDRQEAEDQVQTSFMNAWTRLGSFQFESKFSTWFRTIVFNQSLMRLRVAKREKLQSLDDQGEDERPREYAGNEPSPESQLSRRQMAARLREEVKKLPPLLREVLVLRDLDGLSTEEVAVRLGISEAATKSRLSRARQMLKERMERHVGRSPSLVV